MENDPKPLPDLPRNGGWVPPWAFDGMAAVPLGLSIVLLPFMFGGRYPGWLDLAEAATFLAVGLLAFAGKLRLPTSRAGRLLAAALGLVTLAGLASALFSPAPSISYPQFVEWVWLAATGLLALFLGARRRSRELLGAFLLIAVSAQVFWAFYLWWGSRNPTHQQVGTFYAPNQYAGYVLLLAPLFLALCLTATSQLKAAGAGLVAAYLYLGVALSGSRAGLLAAALGMLAAVVVVSRRSLRRTLLRTGWVIAALVGLGLLMTSPLLFHSATHGTATGVQGVLGVKGADPAHLIDRLRWDLDALRIGIRHPLTGSGLGTFGAALLKVQNPAWQWSLFAHNQYLEAFAEGGLLLFVAMVALPFIAVSDGLRSLWSGLGDEQAWMLGFWAGLVGASAHLVLDHDWSYPAYAAAFVIVAALVVAPWDGTRVNGGQPLRPGRGWRFAIASLAVACLLATAGSYLSGRLVAVPTASSSRLRLAMVVAPYSSTPYEKLGQRLDSGGRRDDLLQAAALLRSAVRRDGYDPSLRWRLADVYAQLGDLGAARQTYQRAIDIVPGAPNAYVLAANFEADSAHDPALAATLLDEGIARLRRGAQGASPVPGLVGLLTTRAQVEEQLGGAASALSFSEEATRVGPGFAKSWLSLHDVACKAGASDVAAQASQKAASLGAPAPAPCAGS